MSEENNNSLLSVRLKKVLMENFRGISHGECEFNCGREFRPGHIEADIVGIYGPNGSGKSTLVHALTVLKLASTGSPLFPTFADYISTGHTHAHLVFSFDLLYEDHVSTAVYAFDLASVPVPEGQLTISFPLSQERNTELTFHTSTAAVLKNETLSLSGDVGGSYMKLQPILQINTEAGTVGPVRKVQQYLGKTQKKEGLAKWAELRSRAYLKYRSSIFSQELLEQLLSWSESSMLVGILADLRFYSSVYLSIVSLDYYGEMISRERQFLLTRANQQILHLREGYYAETGVHTNSFQRDVEGLNPALEVIVPGLKLSVRQEENAEEGADASGPKSEIMCSRNGRTYPLRSESLGIRRIIMILRLLAAVVNDDSLTVVIDEFDSGIQEYLLGELLSSLEKEGAGQLIFTAHNLHPLETLSKNSIIFTTGDAERPYLRYKGLGKTNNLRDVYLKALKRGGDGIFKYQLFQADQFIEACKEMGPGTEFLEQLIEKE